MSSETDTYSPAVDIDEGHVSTAVVHVGNLSHRLGKPASPEEIQKALDAHKVNENVVETFQEIRRHLTGNGVDIERAHYCRSANNECDASWGWEELSFLYPQGIESSQQAVRDPRC